jgi:hypothetical protein
VLHLLDDHQFAAQLARDAHRTCEACTWTAVRGQWLRAYRSVLTPARADAGAGASRLAPPARNCE